MLKDKIALISGGTGAIGEALCSCFARHGAHVAFTYHSQENRAREITSLLDEQGSQTMFAGVEATNGPAIEAFALKVEERFGRIDILVNNIGATQVLPFALIDDTDWDDAVAVNLKSMFLFSKAVVRGMIRRKAGSIVNLGSIGGHRMLEVPVHYATAKAGVTGFTISLAKELSRYGIRVNEVAPGLVDGGIGKNVSDRQLKDYNHFCATGRSGTTTEVAEVVAFLASERASYVNAQTVYVDGGI